MLIKSLKDTVFQKNWISLAAFIFIFIFIFNFIQNLQWIDDILFELLSFLMHNLM